jgi:hypothetical protein
MRLIFSMLFLIITSWFIPDRNTTHGTLRALNLSNAFHDPEAKWGKSVLNFHIEEPRTGNPTRYSQIYLNVADGTFSLLRNREDHITTYSLDANNNPLVLLDGNEQFDEEQRARYRLFPDRVGSYREFYRVMYGLPMSLDFELIRKAEDMREVQFQGKDALMIGIQWYEPILKPYWKIYLEPGTYRVLGVDLTEKSKPGSGERVIFDQLMEYNGLLLPRMRHWHSIQDNEYLGSDIIISQ